MRRGFKRATVVAFLVFLTWSGGITLAGEPTDNPILISKFVFNVAEDDILRPVHAHSVHYTCTCTYMLFHCK
jgi:hypothetical protein